jgi:hypothetical protein
MGQWIELPALHHPPAGRGNGQLFQAGVLCWPFWPARQRHKVRVRLALEEYMKGFVYFMLVVCVAVVVVVEWSDIRTLLG